MSKSLWLIVFLLAANILLTLAALVAFLTAKLAFLSVTDLGPLFVFLGVLVALVTFLINLERGRSDELLKTAIGLLEKAYETLAPKEGGNNLPSNDRHIWLITARLIRTSELIGDQLTEDSHQLIYRETKEYWRSRLHDVVFPSTEGLPSDFYADEPDHMDGSTSTIREPLSERSLAFIYRFIKWPEGLQDPIGDVPRFTPEEVNHMLAFGPRGLGTLFAEVHRLREQRSKDRQ